MSKSELFPSNQRPYCTYEGCKEVCVDAENKRLREFLQLWIYEGRLQSFEDRERFRKAAQAMVSGTPSPSETAGTHPDTVRVEWLLRYVCGAEWRRLGAVYSAGMNRTALNDLMAPKEPTAFQDFVAGLPEEPTVPNAHCNGCGQDYVATKGHVCPAVNGT